ncbi:unnamed protein product [Symbiodinium natans]|uniref:Uncharacterized protein n=1 Tax=Symbiodinium natans TaxID=878477 RepID=A0A812JPN5_9DINO|nr:unnamed protein product [Symbiodinium natans]
MWRRVVAAALALAVLCADDRLPLAKEAVCGTGGQDCPRCNASLTKWSHCTLDAEQSFAGGTTAFLKSKDCPVGMAVFVSSTLSHKYNSSKMADAVLTAPVPRGDEKAREMASQVLRAANKFLLAMPEETVVRGAEIGVKAASLQSMCFGVFLPNSACSLCIEHVDLPDAKVHLEVRQQVNCTVQDWMTGLCNCAGAVTRGRLLGLLYSYVHDMLLMIGLSFHMPDPTPTNLLLTCNPEGSTSFQPPGVQWADFLATSSGQSKRGLLAGSDREIAGKVTVFFGAIMIGAQHPDLASVQQIADLCVARLKFGLKEGVTLCMERVWSEQQKMSDEELRDFRRFVAGEIFFNEIDALSARITELDARDVKRELELKELDAKRELELKELDAKRELELKELDAKRELELKELDAKLADVKRELAEVKTGGTRFPSSFSLAVHNRRATSISSVWVRELIRKDCAV